MRPNESTKKTKILTSDFLIIDYILSTEGNEELKQIVKEYGLESGGKRALAPEQFKKVSEVVKRIMARPNNRVAIEPGGSSANVLVTMNKLLGNGKADVDFLGVVGNDSNSEIIKASLEDGGINLLPKDYKHKDPQAAISYVITPPGGERTIITYPGNAREILKPDIITDNMVKSSDVIFVQGSLWQKLDENFADKLLDLRWNHKKQLWLALPTHAKFGEENANKFQWLVTSANLILGNIEELSRIYKTDPENPVLALDKLRKTFIDHEHVLKGHGYDKPQVAFITLGSKGSAIVTKGGIQYISPRHINSEEIVNTLGAGDTAFAGFAAGYLKGLNNEVSAEIAMALANQKLRHNGARLDDPQAALRKASPKLASLVIDSVNERQLAGAFR